MDVETHNCCRLALVMAFRVPFDDEVDEDDEGADEDSEERELWDPNMAGYMLSMLPDIAGW